MQNLELRFQNFRINKMSKTDQANSKINLKKRSQQRQQWSQHVLQKIVLLRNHKNQSYLERNSMKQIISKISKNQIQIIDKFSSYKVNGFNLLQFVRFFLNIIDHDPIQNLYLTIGLVDLFKEISTFARQEILSFSHITNFICLKILEKKQSKNQIQAKNIPGIKTLKPNYQLKNYIRNPPLIYGSNDQTLFKLCQNSITGDKIKHSRAVCQSYYSPSLKMVFTLDTLSQHISSYEINSNQILTISPSFNKLKKDVVIMGFCFSQRQNRIGAILKNYSLIFWDQKNKFQYEKSWSTTSFCQHLQTFIYFFQYFNGWATCDKTGTIFIWDLLNQKPERKLKLKYFCSITSICEIPSLNIIAVSQESKQCIQQGTCSHSYQQKRNTYYQSSIVLYNFFNGQVVTQIVSDDRIAHTIRYSQQYQVLLSAGLQKRIKLFQINPLYMDANLKGQLIGHQNLITCFTLIKKTSLLVSSDDKGKIKLWDFKNLACIQTIDFSDKAIISNLLDMIQVGKIGVFGSRINYIDFQDKQEVIKQIKKIKRLSIEAVDQDQNKMEIYVFTQKDLRVFDMETGAIKHIFKNFNFCDGDFTCFRYFSCIGMFALGNDKGQIMVYSISTGELLYQLKAQHQGSVLFIQYDQLNKLFVSIGLQSSILIHKETTQQLVREMKSNFYGKQISCFQLSVYHNLIAIGTHQKQQSVYLWNYQYGKVVGEISLKKRASHATSFQFINGFNLLIISCESGDIIFIKIIPSASYEIQMRHIYCISTGSSIIKMNLNTIISGGSKSKLQKCLLHTCHQNGSINTYSLQKFMKDFTLCSHSKQKTNYNPLRQLKENFSSEVVKNKHYKLSCFQQKALIKIQSFKVNQPTNDQKIKLGQLINDKNQVVNAENLQGILLQNTIKTQLVPLNIIKIVSFEIDYILAVGLNRRIKLFSQNGTLLCDMNINYPLPYLWNFKPKQKKRIHDKIYFCIKIINTILSKYQTDISVGQSKNLKLKPLFDSFKTNKQNSPMLFQRQRNGIMLTEPQQFTQKLNQSSSVPILQQEYSKNDLNYQLVKQFNSYEISGPTLKELDHIKKIQLLQKQWKEKQRIEELDREKLLKIIQNKVKKNQQKEQLGNFLSSNYYYKSSQAKETPFIQNLIKKIQILNDEPPKERINNTLFKFFKGSTQKQKQSFKNQTGQDFFRRHKSYKMISKRIQTTFQDYYQNKKSIQKQSNITKHEPTQKALKLNHIQNHKKNKSGCLKYYRSINTAQTEKNKSDSILKDRRNIKQNNKKYERKLASNQHYRFRTILTQMDAKIRNKKIKQIKQINQ